MGKRFQIIIGSSIDYEELVAYVVIDGEHIALLNQDEVTDKIKIEFFDEPKIKSIDFNLLIEALEEARDELLK